MAPAGEPSPFASMTPLTRRDKIAYAIGTIGNAASYILLFFWGSFLFQIGLKPEFAALLMILPKIWDAIGDPFIGYLSDRTRTSWGRRRPWIFWSAIPNGLLFWLLWWFPAEASQGGIFAYFLFIFCIQRTAYTAFMVPYAALTTELSPDAKERESLTLYRFVVGGLANIFFVAYFAIVPNNRLADLMEDRDDPSVPIDVTRRAYMTASLIVMFFVIASSVVCAWMLRERNVTETNAQHNPMSVKEGFQTLMQNRAFLVLTFTSAFTFMSIMIIQGNILQFYIYTMGLTPKSAGVCIIASLAVLIVCVPITQAAVKRFSQRAVYYAGLFVLGVWCLLAYFVPVYDRDVPRDNAYIGHAYGLSLLFGVVFAILFYLPWTMVPDVIDKDELVTGVRREGIHYAVYTFVEKIATGIGLALAGLVLKARDFPTDPVAYAELGYIYRNVICAGGFLVALLSAILLWFYPITKEAHAELQRDMAAYRGKEAEAKHLINHAS